MRVQTCEDCIIISFPVRFSYDGGSCPGESCSGGPSAGGLPDGDMGTDYERILEAVTRVREQSPDGVLIIADMGSSCMTTEMVLEDLDDPQIVMADCPFAEGAVAAMVAAAGGASLEEVKQAAEEARDARKF